MKNLLLVVTYIFWASVCTSYAQPKLRPVDRIECDDDGGLFSDGLRGRIGSYGGDWGDDEGGCSEDLDGPWFSGRLMPNSTFASPTVVVGVAQEPENEPLAQLDTVVELRQAVAEDDLPLFETLLNEWVSPDVFVERDPHAIALLVGTMAERMTEDRAGMLDTFIQKAWARLPARINWDPVYQLLIQKFGSHYILSARMIEALRNAGAPFSIKMAYQYAEAYAARFDVALLVDRVRSGMLPREVLAQGTSSLRGRSDYVGSYLQYVVEREDLALYTYLLDEWLEGLDRSNQALFNSICEGISASLCSTRDEMLRLLQEKWTNEAF